MSLVAATPVSLADARRLAGELRYEEAIVEYQRYLGLSDRPPSERAQALLELGFIHLVLGDEVTAQARAAEALQADPALSLPASAPAKQAAFLEAARQRRAKRVQLTLFPSADEHAPERIRARLLDPTGVVKKVLLRHGLSPTGPYYAAVMTCAQETCEGRIPPPKDTASFTAWYFAEALDEEGNTLTTAASAQEPMQLAVVGSSSWYESPWVWAGGGAAVVAAGVVVFFLSPPPPAPQ